MTPSDAPSALWRNASYPVLLTFDDGPEASVTPKILEILLSYEIQAIFFVVGQRLVHRENRGVLERIVSAGHLVGNHSYTHLDLSQATRNQVSAEIENTQRLLQSLGIRERLFRPPFGSLNQNVNEIVRAQYMWGVGWNCDTRDWDTNYQPNGWIPYGIEQVNRHRESIVLLHDIHPTTAFGLRFFIDSLVRIGRSFPSFFSDTSAASALPDMTWHPSIPGWSSPENLPVFRPTHPLLGGRSRNAPLANSSSRPLV